MLIEETDFYCLMAGLRRCLLSSLLRLIVDVDSACLVSSSFSTLVLVEGLAACFLSSFLLFFVVFSFPFFFLGLGKLTVNVKLYCLLAFSSW